jgi:cytochrome c-type biogenesis protein CcmE
MTRLVVVSLIFAAAVGVLIWVGTVQASIPVIRVSEVLARSPDGYMQVDDGKIVEIASLEPLRFSVAPAKDPAAILWVESRLAPPENFRKDIEVSLRGEYRKDRQTFEATRISTQCPSKYEASKEAEKAKEAAPPAFPSLEGTPPRVAN